MRVKIPPKSLLSPSDHAAVVGGNVLTSQRVTDVIFRAFEACAASQGDCNNLTFGFGGNAAGQAEVKGFGYYETIAGGSGAGPHWDGTSGVHTHMTNTRITDAEVFERRYPVLLREFSIRAGSAAPDSTAAATASCATSSSASPSRPPSSASAASTGPTAWPAAATPSAA